MEPVGQISVPAFALIWHVDLWPLKSGTEQFWKLASIRLHEFSARRLFLYLSRHTVSISLQVCWFRLLWKARTFGSLRVLCSLAPRDVSLFVVIFGSQKKESKTKGQPALLWFGRSLLRAQNLLIWAPPPPPPLTDLRDAAAAPDRPLKLACELFSTPFSNLRHLTESVSSHTHTQCTLSPPPPPSPSEWMFSCGFFLSHF